MYSLPVSWVYICQRICGSSFKYNGERASSSDSSVFTMGRTRPTVYTHCAYCDKRTRRLGGFLYISGYESRNVRIIIPYCSQEDFYFSRFPNLILDTVLCIFFEQCIHASNVIQLKLPAMQRAQDKRAKTLYICSTIPYRSSCNCRYVSRAGGSLQNMTSWRVSTVFFF